jgi:hypothetical protein
MRFWHFCLAAALAVLFAPEGFADTAHPYVSPQAADVIQQAIAAAQAKAPSGAVPQLSPPQPNPGDAINIGVVQSTLGVSPPTVNTYVGYPIAFCQVFTDPGSKFTFFEIIANDKGSTVWLTDDQTKFPVLAEACALKHVFFFITNVTPSGGSFILTFLFVAPV